MSLRWPVDLRLAYWHPVALEKHVGSEPLAIQCCGTPIVLFRKSGSEVAAIYDRCAHRRMPLSHGTVEADCITCPYHGCQFAPDGSGYCPTTRSNRFRVPVFETKRMCGVVWLRRPEQAKDGSCDTGLHNDLADDDHVLVCAIEKKIAAPVQLVVDNMTELEHTGSVHRQLAFGAGDFDTVETRCDHDNESVSIYYRGRQRPLPLYLSVLMGLRRGDSYEQAARVSFTPPCAAYRIRWTTLDQGTTRAFGMRFVNYYTEVDHNHTSLFCLVYWKTAGTLLRCFPGLSERIFGQLVSAELERDKQIIEKVPKAEATLDYFQLNHFDRPLIATRKLMERHYAPRIESCQFGARVAGAASACPDLAQAEQRTKGSALCS